MTFCASLLLAVFCTFPMISILMEPMEPTRDLEQPCDKILKKVGVSGKRMRTVDCPKSIKTPLLKEIPRRTNKSLVYNCRLEEVANIMLHFGDDGLHVSRRMFPNAKMKTQNVSRFGCNFFDGKDVNDKYELCCVFN